MRLGPTGALEIPPPRPLTIPAGSGFLSSQETQNVITKGVVKQGQAARITQTLYFIARLRARLGSGAHCFATQSFDGWDVDIPGMTVNNSESTEQSGKEPAVACYRAPESGFSLSHMT